MIEWSPVAEEEEANRRRGRIQRMLARLSPGRSASLPAICSSRGEVVTDPGEMADALREHWRSVFAGARVDHALLRTWLTEELPGGPPTLAPADDDMFASTF